MDHGRLGPSPESPRDEGADRRSDNLSGCLVIARSRVRPDVVCDRPQIGHQAITGAWVAEDRLVRAGDEEVRDLLRGAPAPTAAEGQRRACIASIEDLAEVEIETFVVWVLAVGDRDGAASRGPGRAPQVGRHGSTANRKSPAEEPCRDVVALGLDLEVGERRERSRRWPCAEDMVLFRTGKCPVSLDPLRTRAPGARRLASNASYPTASAAIRIPPPSCRQRGMTDRHEQSPRGPGLGHRLEEEGARGTASSGSRPLLVSMHAPSEASDDHDEAALADRRKSAPVHSSGRPRSSASAASLRRAAGMPGSEQTGGPARSICRRGHENVAGSEVDGHELITGERPVDDLVEVFEDRRAWVEDHVPVPVGRCDASYPS